MIQFNFKIKYKLSSANPADAPLRRPNYARGYQAREAKVLRNIILSTLQNKLQVQSIQKPTAAYTISQVAYNTIRGAYNSNTGSLSIALVLNDTSSLATLVLSTGTANEETKPRAQPAQFDVAKALIEHRVFRTCTSHRTVRAAV